MMKPQRVTAEYVNEAQAAQRVRGRVASVR